MLLPQGVQQKAGIEKAKARGQSIEHRTLSAELFARLDAGPPTKTEGID